MTESQFYEYVYQREQRSKAMNNWQPIDTAPRDGRRILAYSQNWGEWFPIKWSDNRDNEKGAWSFDTGRLAIDALTPTHWMHLPNPPTE